jgi:hypothetical protein
MQSRIAIHVISRIISLPQIRIISLLVSQPSVISVIISIQAGSLQNIPSMTHSSSRFIPERITVPGTFARNAIMILIIMQYSTAKPVMPMYIRVKITPMHNVTAAIRQDKVEVDKYEKFSFIFNIIYFQR